MSDSSGTTAGPAHHAAAIILAAGRSTRMVSKLPKPLHPICGLPLTGHVVRACRDAGVERIVVVVGHQADAVMAGLGDGVEYAHQAEPRGTGDAVSSAEPLLRDWDGTVLVLAGDVPLLPAAALRRLIEHQASSAAAVTMLTAQLDDPTGYGRVVRDEHGNVSAIVEHKDASAEQRQITEWNPSIYAFRARALWSSLARIHPSNAQGEFYLTDTIGIVRQDGQTVDAVSADSAQDVLGVNNRAELAAAESVLRERILLQHMLAGVSVVDPSNTYIDVDVKIGQDTRIEPGTYLCAGTRIGEDCSIGPLARITRSSVGSRCKIWMSHITEATIGSDASVGPFANLRPGTQLADSVKIGDFVETKNAQFGAGAQASHLSYIGDAEVGAGTNIGAGTITCNYDGYRKHRTVIGRNAFIGSHSTLVAPLTVGDGAFVAAGSAVTANVPADAMAIARARTTLKEGWAAAYRAEKTARPAVAEAAAGASDADRQR
jgi:bifunctional UDP-N-acetylglucosamine pyrophosphorylase / glucosamine-1-phosphate N-acetyltransferase